jgi:hypothetical protein
MLTRILTMRSWNRLETRLLEVATTEVAASSKLSVKAEAVVASAEVSHLTSEIRVSLIS